MTQEIKPYCTNPHWVGEFPAWDIHLTNGEVHKSVDIIQISKALGKLYRLGKMHLFDTYITNEVVTQYHIIQYNRFHTEYEAI